MWKHRGDSQDGRRSRPYTREGLYEAGTIACNYQSKYKKDEKRCEKLKDATPCNTHM